MHNTIAEKEYFKLKSKLNHRPTRTNIYKEIDISIREYLKDGYLRFLGNIGELNEIEENWLGTIVEDFLKEIEKTSISKSYKIPTLLAFIHNSTLKKQVAFNEIGKSFMDYYRDDELHSKDLNNKKHKKWNTWDIDKFTKEAEKNPIHFLSKSSSKFFKKDDINRMLYLNEDLYTYLDSLLKTHFEDILKYKEVDYFNKRFKEEV